MPVSRLNIEPELIRQFQQGNEFAFELIFYRTKDKVNGFLHKALPRGEDIDSVLQEIYLKLWSKRKTVKIEKNFEVYLFAIARNLVIDILRKKFHDQKYMEYISHRLKEENFHNLDTQVKVEYNELEQEIFSLIEQLPERRRKIFKLNRIDGLTYKEIATRLNISENTVDTQIRNSLVFLRSEMKHLLSSVLFSVL